jgi:hypothetical protein
MVQHILDVAGLEGFVVERELLIVDSGETAGIELRDGGNRPHRKWWEICLSVVDG